MTGSALVSEVKAHPTLVVVGETGSGKTTQVRCGRRGVCVMVVMVVMLS
jgi:energy-coupling factor transporter ATP-binding protein EcfA2